MRSTSLKRMVCILVLVGAICFLVVPAGLAVPGQQILLLDREPFYSPPALSLHPGQSVHWHNRSMQPHTITHDGCGQREGCAFHSGHIHPGEQFSVRDLSPGTYPYHCNIHLFMRGVIVVKQQPRQDFNTTEL